MNPPSRLSPLRGRRRHLRMLHRRFQQRAWGEEMARVHLDLTPAQRREYLDRMRSYARWKGVPPRPSCSVAWLLEVEEEVRRDHPELFKP